MNITKADLRGMLERVARAMQSADLDVSHLHLEQGSKTYGRAYRLYLRDPQTGGLSNVPGVWNDGYLGTTRSEAAQSLDMLAAGIRMTQNVQRFPDEPSVLKTCTSDKGGGYHLWSHWGGASNPSSVCRYCGKHA